VAATAALLKRLGAELVHVSVLLELTALGGRERLADQGISSCSAVLTS
jgi:adenine phosphoribosyltransferase